MNSDIIFPWQQTEWQRIWQLHQNKRLPHALLFSGIEGVGKKQFAEQVARGLLCARVDKVNGACGQCHACHLVQAESHSDLFLIEPEEPGQAIKVDQIRAVIEFVNTTALQGGYRVIIINPANAMNINAANSLLKSLEEPTAHCLFILISHQSQRLLPTITSRCQKIVFAKPEKSVALAWMNQKPGIENAELLLNLAQGAPLKALGFFENNFLAQRNDFYQGLCGLSFAKKDPLQFAASWQEVDFQVIYFLLQNWLHDLLKLKLMNDAVDLINNDFRGNYAPFLQKMSLKAILAYSEYMQKVSVNLFGAINLNRLLVLEELFIKWVQHVSS